VLFWGILWLGFLLGVGVAVSRAVAGAVWRGGWRLCSFGSGGGFWEG
jgi:hypothetical protein